MPAKDFIDIKRLDNAAIFAPDLLAFVHTIRSGLALYDKVKGVMDHHHDGVDFAELETRFGLGPGEGPIVYAFISGFGANVATLRSFVDRVG